MPLACQGVKLLTDGEVVELGALVDYTSPTLTAMAVDGGDVDPEEALRTFELDLRMASLGDERVAELVARASGRLIAAFPRVWSE